MAETWRGTHISEFKTCFNKPLHPDVVPSKDHIVLVKLPIIEGKVPEPYPASHNSRDFWDKIHVKLPCSTSNVHRSEERWKTIQHALENNPIRSSRELESAILSYNCNYADQWNFSTLHLFFENVLDETEASFFYASLLPKIIELALSLPEWLTQGVPLLCKERNRCVTLSQQQIACLLANAFLCTFPRRNATNRDAEFADYPDINFSRLYQNGNCSVTFEKLRCLLNYFRRVTKKKPTGVVTFSRNFVPDLNAPCWGRSNKPLPRLYISSTGTIEGDGFGMHQVDFANKFVGGGVLGYGCVQEEIRFLICPELIVSRLFTQCLTSNETLIVTGVERYNNYKGYGNTFEWNGNYDDETPADKYGRKYCVVAAMDALEFSSNPIEQYFPKNIIRELNKAYTGFAWGSDERCAVATGNWGCGAFRGDVQLKLLVQMMAAAEARRDIAYFTFDDTKLRDVAFKMYRRLVLNNVTVGKLFRLLCQFYRKECYKNASVFKYLHSEVKSNNPRQQDSAPNSWCDLSVPFMSRSENQEDAEIESAMMEFSDFEHLYVDKPGAVERKSRDGTENVKEKDERKTKNVMDEDPSDFAGLERLKYTMKKLITNSIKSSIENMDDETQCDEAPEDQELENIAKQYVDQNGINKNPTGGNKLLQGLDVLKYMDSDLDYILNGNSLDISARSLSSGSNTPSRLRNNDGYATNCVANISGAHDATAEVNAVQNHIEVSMDKQASNDSSVADRRLSEEKQHDEEGLSRTEDGGKSSKRKISDIDGVIQDDAEAPDNTSDEIDESVDRRFSQITINEGEEHHEKKIKLLETEKERVVAPVKRKISDYFTYQAKKPK